MSFLREYEGMEKTFMWKRIVSTLGFHKNCANFPQVKLHLFQYCGPSKSKNVAYFVFFFYKSNQFLTSYI